MLDVVIFSEEDIIDWGMLVGKESYVNTTRFIIINFNNSNLLLDIAEYNLSRNTVTNQISMIDEIRSVSLLKEFGFNVLIKKKFSFTETTKTKLNGFILAGFNTIYYDKNELEFKVGNIFTIDFFTEEEVAYLSDLLQSSGEYYIDNILNYKI